MLIEVPRLQIMMDITCNFQGQETPLHIACKFGFTEVVKFLVSLPYLEKGRENRWGETAEQVAIGTFLLLS